MDKKRTFKFIVFLFVIVAITLLSIFGLSLSKSSIDKASIYESTSIYNKNSISIIPSVKDIKLGLDISGGISIVYKIEKSEVSKVDLERAKQVIRTRLDQKNLFDAIILTDESKGWIIVDIPNEKDPDKAIAGLGKTAKVEFTDENGVCVLDGSDIESAKYRYGATDNTNLPVNYVELKFKPSGVTKFSEATGKNIGKKIFIKLDGVKISEPTVSNKITTPIAVITMGASKDAKSDAESTALLIDSGSLPFSLSVISKDYVGPSVGKESLDISVKAGLIGLALVFIFMIIIYRTKGVIADLLLVLYIALYILILSVTKITLTLPGIAGIILSIGVAVDANIIIFERIKEEIKKGKTAQRAIESGFENAFHSILDANVTGLISAFVLYAFGIGPIKGFGIILSVGILISMFTSITLTKYAINLISPLISKKEVTKNV